MLDAAHVLGVVKVDMAQAEVIAPLDSVQRQRPAGNAVDLRVEERVEQDMLTVGHFDFKACGVQPAQADTVMEKLRGHGGPPFYKRQRSVGVVTLRCRI